MKALFDYESSNQQIHPKSEITFKVIDTGVGIPPEDQAVIFEPFQRGEEATTGGTGLGLAIAYSVVQAHSGSLGVETAPGGGACFVIGIPRQAA